MIMEVDIYFGQVFLTFRNETKRALLPNEVTSLDTLRALFVRAFPDNLSMALFESATKRIYVLDPITSVFYELEDLRDVKDKTVLKVYERDRERDGSLPPAPPSPLRSPALRRPDAMVASCFPGYDSDSSVRSAPPAPVGGTRSPQHHQPTSPRLFHYEVPAKAGSLPVQPNYVYQQQMQRQGGPPPPAPPPHRGGPPWSPTHRGRGGQHYSGPPRSNQSSPQRTPVLQPGLHTTPQRHSVAYLPDPTIYGPGGVPLQQSRSYHDYPDQDAGSSRSGSITPTHGEFETKERMVKMEAQLANLQAWVENAARFKQQQQRDASSKQQPQQKQQQQQRQQQQQQQQSAGGAKPIAAQSVTSVMSESSYSAKSKSNSTTPTIQSPTSSVQPGMSDISSATPQAFISVDMQNSICAIHKRALELKSELGMLRQAHLANQETMRDSMQKTFEKIKEAVSSVPSAESLPLRAERTRMDGQIVAYKAETTRVTKDLSDLESSVEELRNDVLNKKCRVNLAEVEAMALALSNISKGLAELKGKFPQLTDRMKNVMSGEMEVVVKEERFIKEEPEHLDNALKRCKKLTGTLFTLKRLAAVQEQRPPQVPAIKSEKCPGRADLLDNITAMVPDHEGRVQSLQAADESRERKKKLLTGTDALKFSKSIEMAQKQLKETHNITANEQRQEKILNEIYASEMKKLEEAKVKDVPKEKEVTSAVTVKQQQQQQQQQEVKVKADSQGQMVSPEQAAKNAEAIAPKKPPRTMEYTEIANMAEPAPVTSTASDSVVNVSAISVVQPVSTSQGQSVVKMATFGPVASPTSLVVGTASGTERPPAPMPVTSTPKSQAHVTFSGTVVEIKDTGGKDGNKPKKIPPPPPPRKSSTRSILASSATSSTSPPESKIQQMPLPPRPASPHTYENLETLRLKQEGQKRGQRPRSAEVTRDKGPPPATRPKSAISPTSGRPLNKFQQELAAGMYSNLNRPDLQDQKVNHMDTVRRNSRGEADKPDCVGGDSSCAGPHQCGVKVEDGAKDKGQGQNGVRTGIPQPKDAKKVPPPPPVRKTSALTGENSPPGETQSKLPQKQRECMCTHKQNGQKPLTNGDLLAQAVVKGNAKDVARQQPLRTAAAAKISKKFEETEIY